MPSRPGSVRLPAHAKTRAPEGSAVTDGLSPANPARLQRVGDVAIVLAAFGTVVAFRKLRPGTDLWVGSAVLIVLLVLASPTWGV